MPYFRPLVLGLILCLASGGWAIAQNGSPSFSDLAQQKQIERDLDAAEQLLGAGDSKQAAAIWGRANVRANEWTAGRTSQSLVWAAATLQRMVTVHQQCVAEGTALEPIDELIALSQRVSELAAQSKPAAVVETPPSNPASTTETAPVAVMNADAVSFSQVAPILLAKCGRCHVDRRQGRFSLATYQALMDKPDAVHAGDPETSEIIELIENGEMPRGGLTVTPEELELLKNWIAQGAKCVESDRGKNLAEFSGAPMAPAIADTTAAVPSTETTISFAKHVAPILIDNCAGCHMDGRQLRGGLNLATFETLVRGGDNGALVVAGDGEESLLIKKLRGTAGGQQMPAGTEPLAEPIIALVSAWIQQGAKFDGFSPAGNIRDVSSRARAADATHEQLATERQQRAVANWQLVMGGKTPVLESREDLVVLGMDESAEVARFADVAESVIGKVKSQLRLSSREPLLKGKTAAYLFQVRYDYSEFGKMIESRDLPREFFSHWGNTTLDAYIAVQARPADYEAIKPVLAQHFAAIQIRGLAADVPNWFADGYAYWIAARAYSGDDFIKQWDQKSLELLQAMPNKDDFIVGRMNDFDAGLVGYQFINFLKANGNSQFNKLLRDLRDGNSFDRSFQVQFGLSPAEIIAASQPPPQPQQPPGQ